MGSPIAPSIANLFMANLEEKFIFNPSNNPFFNNIQHYHRYIDDLILIYTHPQSIDAFLQWFDTIHESIRFSAKSHKNCVSFLGTVVYRNSDKLGVRLHVKGTDRNSYLNFRSFHPFSLKCNIPFSQFLRIKRNCTKTADFDTFSRSLREKFIARDYPKDVVDDSLRRANRVSRTELLGSKPDKTGNKICCSSAYSPLALHIKRIILKHWHILGNVPGCETPQFIAMRKTRSIKDMLVHSSLDRITRAPVRDAHGHYKCHNCSACRFVVEGKEFVNPSDKRKYRMRHLTSCSSKFCVYAITCECQMIYVGSTSRCVKIRILEHVAWIKNCIKNCIMEAPLTSHFVTI